MGRYGAEAMITKPNFHSRSVFSENLITIEICKLEFNKQIHIGMYIWYSIYRRSVCMNFITNICYPYIAKNVKLCIQTPIASYIASIVMIFIDKWSVISTWVIILPIIYMVSLANKKVSDLMKDENNGAMLTEFVGLRAKICALRW